MVLRGKIMVLKHSQQGTKYVASGPQLVPLGPYDEILGEIENKYVLKQTEYVRWRPRQSKLAQNVRGWIPDFQAMPGKSGKSENRDNSWIPMGN